MGIVSGGGGGGGGFTKPSQWTVDATTGELTIQTTGNNQVPLTLIGAAGQSADLLSTGYGSHTIFEVNPATPILGKAGSDATELVLQPHAAQTNPIVEIDGLGGGVFYIDPNAYLKIAVNAAPADAALNAGECALWFDQTNAAAKLMAKAKTANGTVVTAAVALS